MNDTVETLKELIEKREHKIKGFYNEMKRQDLLDLNTKRITALKEALLWKEKLDRLEKWLNKQETPEEQKKQNFNIIYLGMRLNILKEVRAILNEKKEVL